MRKNNLYTKSYFIKRLTEARYFVTRVVDKYHDEDERYWTINIRSSAGHMCMITCIKNTDTFYFRVNGPNDSNTVIETLSMNVIFDTLEHLLKGVDVLKISLED